MPTTTQDNRFLNLTTTLDKDFLLIERMRVSEELSRQFRYELTVVTSEESSGFKPTVVSPSDVLGKPMSVAMTSTYLDGGDPDRYFHGICVSFSQGNRDRRFTYYGVELAPAVWFLTQVVQNRIFQQKSVPDILAAVLKGYNVKFELQGIYEPRNYCVQYRESDWDFVSRLMEEEGIFYFFEHSATDHVMVIANTPQSHPNCPSTSTFPFVTDTSSGNLEFGRVVEWRVDNWIRTGKYTTWDYNFELPGKNLQATGISRFTIGENQKFEIYDYPGEYAKHFDGVDPSGASRAADLQKIFEERQRTVSIRQQEIDASNVRSHGTGDATSLTAGHKFVLSDHPEATNNGAHLIVSLESEAVQTPTYETHDLVPNAFTAAFTCQPQFGETWGVFRPERTTPRPRIPGTQTAVVVGPPGQEIFTDKYGRVKVQFHWDRQGKMDSNSSCWVRVATSWAGKQWGAIQIPRTGMEVLVSFIDGDPDQPIIVGAVYNPNTMPPYRLPDEKTISTLKSNSSTGGSGFNEMCFEDKAGSEVLYIHAQRDHETRVLRDAVESIDRDSHLTVDRNQIELVKRDKSVTVNGNQAEKIDGAMGLKVGTSTEIKSGTKIAAEAGTEIHLKSGATTVIEAGVSLTLKVGGNFVSITPAGVSIQGTMVMINSGGAAGSGSGAAPETPATPRQVVDSPSGRAVEPATQIPPPPPQPPALEKLASAVRNAAPTEGSSDRVDETVRNMIAEQRTTLPVEIIGPVPDAVEEARETVAQYSDPGADETGSAAAPAVSAASEAEKAAADDIAESIQKAADAYQQEREQVQQAQQLVAAYETAIGGVGKQSMSLLNAADKAAPFSRL